MMKSSSLGMYAPLPVGDDFIAVYLMEGLSLPSMVNYQGKIQPVDTEVFWQVEWRAQGEKKNKLFSAPIIGGSLAQRLKDVPVKDTVMKGSARVVQDDLKNEIEVVWQREVNVASQIAENNAIDFFDRVLGAWRQATAQV